MSEIRATTISDLAGTGPATLTGQYAAKAWVNFNGTGTVAIRQSQNVSSITDNNVGRYTVNFTAAFADTNYSTVTSTSVNYTGAFDTENQGRDAYISGQTTGTLLIESIVTTTNAVYQDLSYYAIIVIR